MGRILALAYGVAAYAVFLGTFLYAIGFTSGLVVPKTVDTGPVRIDRRGAHHRCLAASVFAIQHSVMARVPFKRWWTQFVPPAIERSTYVLLASLALILVFWQWRPIPAMVWEVTQPTLAMAVLGVAFFGWGMVLLSTFLINHFELFGLQQVLLNLVGKMRRSRASGRPSSTSSFAIRSISASSSPSGRRR